VQILVERLFKLKQVVRVSGTLNTTEDRHSLVLTFASKLKLALADLQELSAPLNEGFILSEDGLGVKLPVLAGTVLLNDLLVLATNVNPLTAAVHGLIEILNALLNVTVKHIIDVNLGLAPIDDLVTDLDKQTLHAFFSVVVGG
jgi:hypothetical protein